MADIYLCSIEEYSEIIKKLEKDNRELTRKVKRRDNKIIELSKEIKRLRKLEDTDISIIRACLPELFNGKKIVIARKPESPKKEPEVIQIYMYEFVGEKE